MGFQLHRGSVPLLPCCSRANCIVQKMKALLGLYEVILEMERQLDEMEEGERRKISQSMPFDSFLFNPMNILSIPQNKYYSLKMGNTGGSRKSELLCLLWKE